MKRRHYFFLMLFCFTHYANAQLIRQLNSMRAGDEIIKTQVQYKDPGKGGTNCFWDFSKLTPLNPEYTLAYDVPGIVADTLFVMGRDTLAVDLPTTGDLITGTEHYTMYYYQLRGDSLFQLGHENPNTELRYTKPLLHLKFPFNYGDVLLSDYKAEGSYSGTIDVSTQGTMRTEADAFGKMILPQGDTLTVLRIKSTRLIQEPYLLEDSTEAFTNRVMETYQWYSKGYRYPVFETIKTIHLGDSINRFTTAFYYPPQEHYYLDKDPENVAVLDSLWEVKYGDSIVEQIEKTTKINIKLHPSPVRDELYIDYELNKPSSVTIIISDLSGQIMWSDKKNALSLGLYTERVDCSTFITGNYIVNVITDFVQARHKILKK